MEGSQKSKKEANIERWMAEHNLTREEAEQLTAYSQDRYLTVEQKRIKYDYPELGLTYPEWLTKEQHLDYCMKAAKRNWKPDGIGRYYSQYDLGVELFIFSSNNLNKIKNERVLNTALNNLTKRLNREGTNNTTVKKSKKDYTPEDEELVKNGLYRVSAGSRIAVSLDQPVTNGDSGEESTTTFGGLIPDTETQKEIENIEFIDLVESLKKPKELKYLFVLCGYIISGLDSLEEEFNKILKKISKEKADRLVELKDRQSCFQAERDGLVHTFTDGRKKPTRKVTLHDIMNVMGMNFYTKICSACEGITVEEENECEEPIGQTKMDMKKLLKELAYYLSETGISQVHLM